MEVHLFGFHRPRVKEDYAGIPIRLARNYGLSGVKFSLRASACFLDSFYIDASLVSIRCRFACLSKKLCFCFELCA